MLQKKLPFSKEDIQLEQKFEKCMSTLVGIKLREILSRSVESLLNMFKKLIKDCEKDSEIFPNNKNENNTKINNNKPDKTITKFLDKNSYCPIFRTEIIIDNGFLKINEFNKKLVEEFNLFFISLCKSFDNFESPESIKRVEKG